MSKTPHDSSFSFSRRFFNWKKKAEDEEDMEEYLAYNPSWLPHGSEEELKAEELDVSVHSLPTTLVKAPRKKSSSIVTISKLRSAFSFGIKSRSHMSPGLGTRVVCTLFGYRRGHVHLAFQEDVKLSPAFLVELATPTSVLVREMASGLVRIALECEKKMVKKGPKLLEEPVWRTYCNGKKCGYATRRECGPDEWKVLNAVGPITMGAGVLPASGDGGVGSEGELMYMRAKFERVVGSKDSEAFYMMSPDGNGGPELSIYLLRA